MQRSQGSLIRSVPLSGNRLNYVSRVWPSHDPHRWAELHQINTWSTLKLRLMWNFDFSLDNPPYPSTVPSQLDVASMDFLSLRGGLLAAGGSFHTRYSPKCNCGLGSMQGNRCAVALKHATPSRASCFPHSPCKVFCKLTTFKTKWGLWGLRCGCVCTQQNNIGNTWRLLCTSGTIKWSFLAEWIKISEPFM